MVDPQDKMIAVFEMIVSRLDTIEETQSLIKTQLDQQDLAARYADSLRPTSIPFPGMNMTGKEVELTVHFPFDSNGAPAIKYDHCFEPIITNDDMVILVDEREPFSHSFYFWIDGIDSEWDTDLIKAWGKAEYERVRSTVTAWWVENPDDGQNQPSSKEIGIDSTYQHANWAIVEAALRQRVPGFVAHGIDGVAVSLVTLRAAVQCTLSVMRLLDRHTTSLQCYWIPCELQTLALEVMRDSQLGGDPVPAWKALSKSLQANLKHGHYPYFTKERLCGLI